MDVEYNEGTVTVIQRKRMGRPVGLLNRADVRVGDKDCHRFTNGSCEFDLLFSAANNAIAEETPEPDRRPLKVRR